LPNAFPDCGETVEARGGDGTVKSESREKCDGFVGRNLGCDAVKKFDEEADEAFDHRRIGVGSKPANGRLTGSFGVCSANQPDAGLTAGDECGIALLIWV
jgi:hypothetical protein